MVFPGHPDDPAVIKPMVMPKQQVLPFPGKSCLLYDYSCCGSWVHSSMGNAHLCICGDEVSKMSTSAP